MTSLRTDGRPEPPEDSPRGLDEWPDDHDEQLILWMLDLSPEERLGALQGFVDGVLELRDGRRGPLPRDP